MKLMFCFLFLFPPLANALEVYKSTQKDGLNKYERINQIEDYLKKMSLEVNKLKAQASLKEEIKQLMAKIEELERKLEKGHK